MSRFHCSTSSVGVISNAQTGTSQTISQAPRSNKLENRGTTRLDDIETESTQVFVNPVFGNKSIESMNQYLDLIFRFHSNDLHYFLNIFDTIDSNPTFLFEI